MVTVKRLPVLNDYAENRLHHSVELAIDSPTDFVTVSFTAIVKTDSVTDLKIMFQATDKDIRIALTEAVMVPFVVKFECAFVSWGVFKSSLLNFEK